MIEIDGIKIQAKYDDLVNPEELKGNPENNNKHPIEQILRLAKIYLGNCVRNAITVSKQSGMIVTGHARRLAAIHLGMKKFPVVYQDFETPALEYAHMTADNELASWAEIDMAMVNVKIPDLGPELDLELLGFRDIRVDAFEKEEEPQKEKQICETCKRPYNK